jgi:para-nitrobenzyl esterase
MKSAICAFVHLASLVALMLVSSHAQAEVKSITVLTSLGEVVGQTNGYQAHFLGIPYAAAPVGALRLKRPQPHTGWTGPLQATSYGSPCLQPGGGAEDCLFLNIFAPISALHDGPKRPVMVWIHGGGYFAGAANDGADEEGHGSLYDPRRIVATTDVVVVSFNYRLGTLGFLTHEALSAETPEQSSGNYGIEDQQAALAWVQEHIAAFGGDRNNVTIFGESAGGNSVLINLASSAASGLFNAAIAESPLFGAVTRTAEVAQKEWGNNVVAAVGCAEAADTAACLRAQPADSFVSKTGIDDQNPLGFALPIIDGLVLKTTMQQAFSSDKFDPVPIIIGSNFDEGTLLTGSLNTRRGHPITVDEFHAVLEHRYGDRSRLIEQVYPTGTETPSQILAAIYGDSLYACPTSRMRDVLAESSAVYGYEFTEPRPVGTQGYPKALPQLQIGDAHTFELAYVFGHNGSESLPPRAAALARVIVAYWTNLARSGDPNLGLSEERRIMVPIWPVFDTTRRQIVSLQDHIETSLDFEEVHRCKLWRDLNPAGLF